VRLVRRLVAFTWYCALGVSLVISALTTDRRARQVEENPSFCDPFGYLLMAQDIRQSVAAGKAPQFTLEATHTRLLIQLMQKHEFPVRLWDEMVSPLACHYFPVADHVGVQYSPGAGLMLALFPEGRALRGLNRLVTIVFLVTGLMLLFAAAYKRVPFAAGLLILALNLGLEVVAQLDNASFSINALLAPLLLSGVLLAAVWVLQTGSARNFYFAWLLTIAAGLLFGFAMLARLPVLLLLPGVLLVLCPVKLKRWYRSAWVPFVLGVFLGGVLPLMVHQSRTAGAWYLPTYTHENTTLPTLASVRPNFSFYFGPGKASTMNWVLAVIFLGCLGLALWSGSGAKTGEGWRFVRAAGWTRFMAAALLMLLLSTVYFLTHTAAVHYYPFPAMFGAVVLLALGACALENHSTAGFSDSGWLRRSVQVLALLLAAAPGLIVMGRVWSNYIPATTAARPKQFSLPSELRDESAWVWACSLSGTLWYYERKPAHKLSSTNAETREIVYRYVAKRGDPQYVIIDDEGMKAVADEIVEIGGTLERRGEVDGYPYFLIHWSPRSD